MPSRDEDSPFILAVCLECDQYGDARTMPNGYHGRCFLKRFGRDALLALPTSILKRIELGELGIEIMYQNPFN